MTTANPFTELASRYQRRAEIAARLSEIVANDPGFVDDLIDLLKQKRNGQAPTQNGKRPPTHIGQIIAYFKANGNKWATAPDLMRDIGMSRAQVGTVLYKAGIDYFQRRKSPKHKRLVLWRLKNATDD